MPVIGSHVLTSHVRGMRRFEFPDISLFIEVFLHHFIHPEFLTSSSKVDDTIRSVLFGRPSQYKKESLRVFMELDVLRDYQSNMHGPWTHAAEDSSPSFCLQAPCSSASSHHRPGSKNIIAHLGKRWHTLSLPGRKSAIFCSSIFPRNDFTRVSPPNIHNPAGLIAPYVRWRPRIRT